LRDKSPRVVITDAEYPSHEPELAVLSKLKVKLVKFNCKTEDDVIRNCMDADALLNQYAPITRRVIENLRNAKIIARYGVGVDNVDLEAATQKGIFVTNVIYDICDVADHTIALMLSLVRKIPSVLRNVKNYQWDWKVYEPISRIKDLKVGVVGFGRVGREVAKRITSFGATVVGYDPYVQPEIFKKMKVEKIDFHKLLKESDVVTLHTMLTEETHHLIGVSELREMKKKAVLINVSRGPVIDEEALCTALREKWIAGAALDVLEREPPEKNNPLLELDNVIVTPHMAWYSTGSLLEIQTKAAEEVARVLCQETPVNLVNKGVLKQINE